MAEAGPGRRAALHNRAVSLCLGLVHRLLFRCLLGVVFLLCGLAPAQADDEAVVTVTEAEFSDGRLGPWRTVALPDTWALRGQAHSMRGTYRARFVLPAAPGSSWALRIDRLSSHHEVRLNGELVHGTLDRSDRLRRPMQAWIALPPTVLRSGSNELEITIDAGVRAGMSAWMLGPVSALEAGYAWSRYRQETLPQMLNAASAGVALFVLLLWWVRRSDVAMGSFAALSLLMSLRNQGYLAAGSPFPSGMTDLFFFLAQVATPVLLGVFAMAFSGRSLPGYRSALLATATLLPLLAVWASWAGVLHQTRTWIYPWLLSLALPALALVLMAARARRSATELTLVGTIAVMLGVSLHDYLYQQGRTSIMDTYWVPYAVPLLLMAFAATQLQRLVAALAAVEQTNQTLEQRVAERTRELAAANSAKTRFLAAASHDLRQPMLSIGLLVGLLREQAQSPAMTRVVQRLSDATLAMEGLLKRLLDLSRLEASTARARLQALPLQTLFDAVGVHHAEQAQDKGLRLVLRRTDAVVHSDPMLLEQLLRNLVGNAVRYTDSGAVLVAARSSGRDYLRIEVWDSGPGIPADRFEAIFAEFVKFQPVGHGGEPDSLGGLGLGLSIVKRCADLLGTEVLLHSTVGRGSRFSVRLARAHSVPVAVPAAAVVNRSLLAGRVVWLLEDDGHARDSMTLRLQHWGATVQSSTSLQSFRRLLGAATVAPDLLLTDQRLPDGQGSDALKALRERWPLAAAVIVTGNTAPSDLPSLQEWDADGVPVLHKPFTADELLAAAQRALSVQVG